MQFCLLEQLYYLEYWISCFYGDLNNIDDMEEFCNVLLSEKKSWV